MQPTVLAIPSAFCTAAAYPKGKIFTLIRAACFPHMAAKKWLFCFLKYKSNSLEKQQLKREQD